MDQGEQYGSIVALLLGPILVDPHLALQRVDELLGLHQGAHPALDLNLVDFVLEAPDFALQSGAPVDQGVLAQTLDRGHGAKPAASSAGRGPPHLPQLNDLIAKLLALLSVTRLQGREFSVEDGERLLLLGHDLHSLDGLQLGGITLGILEDPHVLSVVTVAQTPPTAAVFHGREVEKLLLQELDPPVPLPDHGEELRMK